MASIATQCENILEYLRKDDLNKAQEEISKLKDLKKESFDEKVVEAVVNISEIILEKASCSDVLSTDEFLIRDCPLIPILETGALYCMDNKDMERETMDIYNNLYDLCCFGGDFEKGLEYTKKSLEVAKNSNVPEYEAESTAFCSNAALSCALGVTSKFLEDCNLEEIESIPENIEKQALEYVELIVDYSHEAYLLYLKLALTGASELGLIDASLCEKLDDDNIVDTVSTLSSALEITPNSEEVANIISNLEASVEMSERCSEYDGIDITDMIDKVQHAFDGSDCDCDCDCDCCNCDDDEEEEEEEEEEEVKEVKSCKRGCCNHDGGDVKKCKK